MDFEIFPHEHFMSRAYEQAQAAREIDEVPVGAIIERGGRIIGAAHNLTRQLKDPTAHAEMLAITQAAEAVGDWRLNDCTIYVTLEPCPMCAGALVNSRMGTVVYGATDPKAGAVESLFQLLQDERLNHRSEVVSGIMNQKCGQILTEFFREKRQQARNQ
jgi:tRNA(adenine34) deaminase